MHGNSRRSACRSAADLQPGDVVLAIDGTPVMSAQRAIKLIREAAKQSVVFNVLRNEVVEAVDDTGAGAATDAARHCLQMTANLARRHK